MEFNEQMLGMVDAEIERLQSIRKMLIGGSLLQPSTAQRRVVPAVNTRRRTINRRIAKPVKQVRRPMSAADRKKRSDAQKARWNRVRAAQSATPPAPESDSRTSASPDGTTPIKAVS